MNDISPCNLSDKSSSSTDGKNSQPFLPVNKDPLFYNWKTIFWGSLENSRFVKALQEDKALFLFDRNHALRKQATRLWLTLVLIFANCVSIAMMDPCNDKRVSHFGCKDIKCIVIFTIDDIVNFFFFFEMIAKMFSACAVGHKKSYFADAWNRLDFFIVIASVFEYIAHFEEASSLTLFRLTRILRPIRTVKRIPNLQLLVTLLYDTLPALSNIIAIIVFIYFCFGIIGVQLWSGVLRQRCFLSLERNPRLSQLEIKTLLGKYYDDLADDVIDDEDDDEMSPFLLLLSTSLIHHHTGKVLGFSSQLNTSRVIAKNSTVSKLKKGIMEMTLKDPGLAIVPAFYESPSQDDFICGGYLQCNDIINFERKSSMCEDLFEKDPDYQDKHFHHHYHPLSNRSFCNHVIANYSKCQASTVNPFKGGVSFDNIIASFVTIFQAASPEGWNPIMYTVQDGFSFWAWPYFILLILTVTFGVSNLSFIVIAVQIPRTKMRLMKKARKEAGTSLVDGKRLLDMMAPTTNDNTKKPATLYKRQSHARLPVFQSNGTAEANSEENKNAEADVMRNNFYTQLVDAVVDWCRRIVTAVLAKRKAYLENKKSKNNKVNATVQDKKIEKFWTKVDKNRAIWRRILRHGITITFISLAILVNTISMAMEHHNQPQSLTVTVDLMNAGFTALYTVELVLKIYAFGFIRYIRNGFNMLDFIIVIVSLIELAYPNGKTFLEVTALRTFRILRVAKLIRFLPSLQRQLVTMFRTLNNVAPFLLLFSLFLFIFCVLGMTLFGCEFCKKYEAVNYPNGDDNQDFPTLSGVFIGNDTTIMPINETDTLQEETENEDFDIFDEDEYQVLWSTETDRVIRKLPPRQYDKKNPWGAYSCNPKRYRPQGNFDSLLSSLLTVLKILTQDDGWSDVMRDTMFYRSSYLPAIYFMCLLLLGHYIVISMLLAIIDVGASPTAAKIMKTAPKGVNFTSLLTISAAWRGSGLLLDNDNECFRLIKRRRLSFLESVSAPLSKFGSLEDVSSLTSYQVALTNSPVPSTPSNNKAKREFHFIRRNASYVNAIGLGDYLAVKQDSDAVNAGSQSSYCRRGILVSPSGNRRRKDSRVYFSDNSPISSSFNSLKSSPLMLRRRQNDARLRLLRLRGILKARTAFINSLTVNTRLQRQETEEEEEKKLDDSDSVFASPPSSPHQITKQDTVATPEDLLPIINSFRRLSATSIVAANQVQSHTSNDESRLDYSLYLFAYTNPVRQFFRWLINWPRYDKIMMIVVVANCVTVALERPSINPHSFERRLLDTANYFFSGIFLAEAVVKIISDGFLTYLRNGWNVVDFGLVVLSTIDLSIEFAAEEGQVSAVKALRALRLLRTFRPLRVISHRPSLIVVVRMLTVSVKSIANIMLICGVVFLAFAVLGLQLLRGCFYRCELAIDDDGNFVKQGAINYTGYAVKRHLSKEALLSFLKTVKTRDDCLGVEGLEWRNQQYNFDTFFQSIKSLMVVASFDGWIGITQNGLNCVNVNQQPIENFNPWRLLFFLAFFLIIGFCLVEMFVGVIVNNYSQMKADSMQHGDKTLQLLNEAGKRLEAWKLANKSKKQTDCEAIKHTDYWLDYSKWRHRLYHICTHVYMDVTMAVLIAANVIVMSIEYYAMPPQLKLTLQICNYIFTGVFTLEVVAKLTAFGLGRYVKSAWNLLDLTIVVLSLLGVALKQLQSFHSVPIVDPKVVRLILIIRVAKALRIFRVAKSAQYLVDTVKQTLSQVGNMALLFLLVFFVYASLGVELFGQLHCPHNSCTGISRHANFHNFGMALLILFRISTGDNWTAILEDVITFASDSKTRCFAKYNTTLPLNNSSISANSTVEEANDCRLVVAISPFYFTSFFVITQFFLVNIIVAVLMRHLEKTENILAKDITSKFFNASGEDSSISAEVIENNDSDTTTKTTKNLTNSKNENLP